MKPVFGVYEWAKYSENCILGCKNNCRYCFSKANAISRGAKTKENWTEEVVIGNNKNFHKKDGTIMFPSAHDIGEENADVCLLVLDKMLKVGNNVLIVSKPRISCINMLCDKLKTYKTQILFRFTIGSASDKTLLFWEPNASSYMERIASLRLANKLGFNTSISCEPMLDDNIHKVVADTLPYVTDAIWLGKANYLLQRLKVNGEANDVVKAAKELLETQHDDFIKELYNTYKDNSKVKWKESIKKIIGLEIPTKKGQDI